jgi:hypothetical protein
MGVSSAHVAKLGLFEGYDTGGFYDEMFRAPGQPRAQYAKPLQRLATMARRSLRSVASSPTCRF